LLTVEAGLHFEENVWTLMEFSLKLTFIWPWAWEGLAEILKS